MKKIKQIEVIEEEKIKILPTDLCFRYKGITLVTEPTKNGTALRRNYDQTK